MIFNRLSENNYCKIEMNLDGEQDGSDLKSRTPLFLQDVEADSAKLVYVWVVDPRDEPDLTIIVMNVTIVMKYSFTFGAVIG